MCAGIFFFTGALSALALFLLTGENAAFSVLFSALLTGSMHGVNLILICMIPPFFKPQGNVSTVSGILNSCTYIGSAISTYGIAVLSENIGWSNTLLVWLLIALLGTAICAACVKPWKLKMSSWIWYYFKKFVKLFRGVIKIKIKGDGYKLLFFSVLKLLFCASACFNNIVYLVYEYLTSM